jgi:di/tricarboxylate transporter
MIMTVFSRRHILFVTSAVLMSVVIVCWVTEAVPYFVTAIFIPVLTVLLQILADDTTHKVLAPDAASKVVFSKIFDHSVALVLGGAHSVGCVWSRV